MVGNQMAATGTEGRQKGCDIVFGIVESVEVAGSGSSSRQHSSSNSSSR